MRHNEGMARITSIPAMVELASVAVLGFFACMPRQLEVGRDSALGDAAGVDGEGPNGVARGGTGGSDSSPGGESAAGEATVTPTRGGGPATAAGGKSSAGGRGFTTGGLSSGARGGEGAVNGVAGVGLGSAGQGTIGGAAGMPATTTFSCPVDDASQEVLWPLDTFCQAFGCPNSPDDAVMRLLGASGGCTGVRSELRKGCDELQLSVSATSTGSMYLFAANPVSLVGAGINSDIPWGPCKVLRYYGGVPPQSCNASDSCSFCDSTAKCAP
ncbi:MAG TPA: hypothetical protein VGQ57_08075 [Polyangiaceae bacterium]|nr:hypothetical protein [Polyangiaceae bacterium]